MQSLQLGMDAYIGFMLEHPNFLRIHLREHPWGLGPTRGGAPSKLVRRALDACRLLVGSRRHGGENRPAKSRSRCYFERIGYSGCDAGRGNALGERGKPLRSIKPPAAVMRAVLTAGDKTGGELRHEKWRHFTMTTMVRPMRAVPLRRF